MKEQEFVEVVSSFKDKAFRLARRLLVTKELAEDAVQELYIKLWERKKELSKIVNMEAFAMRITKNYCLDLLKSKSANNISLQQIFYEPSHDHLQKSLEADDNVTSIQKAMNSLSEKERLVLQLRDIEGYDFEAIADILGGTPATVRVRLSRARKALKEKILQQL